VKENGGKSAKIVATPKKRTMSAFARRKIAAAQRVPRYASAWLFVGPSGTGKTSMALAICNAIAGELHHIPSQSCDLATVKATTDRCHYYPRILETGQPGRFHVVLADEADRMTPAAQLAFLSKLDGTAFPPNTIFVFTCNTVDCLESRFLCRCRRVEFSSYGLSDGIAGLLQRVWDAETDSQDKPNFARMAKGTNTCAFTEYRSGKAGEIPRPFWTEIEFSLLS
jgi:replication-associated recombination protein RarA